MSACARLAGLLLLLLPQILAAQEQRPRARDLGIRVGIFEPGEHNAITDVAGVRVGHATVRAAEVNTGVTAILPPGERWYHERVPAAIVVGNGFGKLLGATQVQELGELETPILLTCTLCVWRAADALSAWLLARPGMEQVRSINPVVGETNDGFLNDIRSRSIDAEHVHAAVAAARGGEVEEGSVGAGTGTVAFGWKGGIGTASRRLPRAYGGWTVGALVQTNYGGVLTIAGAPVGIELGRHAFRREGDATAADQARDVADGSVMIVLATDAPLDARALERLGVRALLGLARTGSSMSHGSGDYVIAFSAAESVRRTAGGAEQPARVLAGDALSPLFQAAAEAVEEAIYNSLLRATTVIGARGTVEALPIPATLDILRRYGVVR